MKFSVTTIIAGGVSPLPEWSGISIGALFPVFFIGLWLFITFVIAHSGWSCFAKAYPCPTRPAGRSFTIPTASFGEIGVRYNRAACVVFSEAGLYLYTMILFRAFHPPFLLPWSSVESVKPYSFLWKKGYVLLARDSIGTLSLYLSESQAAELKRFTPHLLDHTASESRRSF